MEFDIGTPDTTSLTETEFSSTLRRISAQRLLVLIDACHSGGAGSFKGGEQEESLRVGYSEKSLVRLAQGTGRVLLASCRANETSIVFDNARNSVFTSKLLEALRGEGQTSGDGVIRVFEIFNHVAQMVRLAVPGRQHPIFKASDLEDNFPVTLDRGGIKSVFADANSSVMPEVWEQLEEPDAESLSVGANGSGSLGACGWRSVSLALERHRAGRVVQGFAHTPSWWWRGRHSQGKLDESRTRGLSPPSGLDCIVVMYPFAHFSRARRFSEYLCRGLWV